jgi:hypothetical protein
MCLIGNLLLLVVIPVLTDRRDVGSRYRVARSTSSNSSNPEAIQVRYCTAENQRATAPGIAESLA